jgi:hypothetical protein
MWVGGVFRGVKCAVLSVYSLTNVVAARAALATQEQVYEKVTIAYQTGEI